ncbi:LuxR C-terminal-related transcriptional regulator [Lentzea sp. NPDC051213]|uniref:LuxR C-terminal-related transcriptional regulator n=1 Tax=Lentzea sp. NPDC051213 TaxID=3364126 RepID=UPI0037A09997
MAGQQTHEQRAGNVVPLAIDSFFGRTSLLAGLRERLTQARDGASEERLITLTGVGGAGKTRLAKELARQLADAFDDGVWLAEFTPVDDPETLVQTVLEAIGVPDQSTRKPLTALVDYVRDRQMLLVLDNCEHVVTAAATLAATLLRSAPGLTIVATSRTLLEVSGEEVVAVPPMRVPARPDEPMPAAPEQEYESVALFAARAQSCAPGWRITATNWAAVVRVLQHLDGIPLAIELTTVRLRSMSIDELDQRMDALMQLLTRNRLTVLPHHATLHAVISWSHDLCTPAEQLLWSRLSVFAGPFTLAAAEAVCSGDGLPRETVVDALDRLVTSSVVMTGDSRHRYWLLVPMRQYAAMRSDERGEQTMLRCRHRDYYRDVANQAAADCRGPREVDVLQEIGRDMPNFRAVMAAALVEPDQAQTGLQVAIALARSRYFFFSGTMPEGIRWLERTLQAAPDADPLLRAAAGALDVWIELCTGQQHDDTWAHLDRAAALAAGLGVEFAPVTQIQGVYRIWAEGDPSGIALLHTAHLQFRALGPEMRLDASMALMLMSIGAALLADEQQARDITAAALQETEREQSPWVITWMKWSVAIADMRFGEPERAVQTLLAILREQREFGDHWGPIWSIEALAWAHAQLGEARRAAVLLGAASALTDLRGVRPDRMVPLADFRRAAEQEVRQMLGTPGYKAAMSLGARIQTYDEAVALVDQQDSTSLTPTQLTVAKLVALGTSNKDIADNLVISQRTVESHVSAILRRLGLTNRREIMIWVADHLA